MSAGPPWRGHAAGAGLVQEMGLIIIIIITIIASGLGFRGARSPKPQNLSPKPYPKPSERGARVQVLGVSVA